MNETKTWINKSKTSKKTPKNKKNKQETQDLALVGHHRAPLRNWNFDVLLQNVTDTITKCHNYFITKYDTTSLQNMSGFLLQNATGYYKMRQLLQNATKLLQNATVIKKCDVYYKMRRWGSWLFLPVEAKQTTMCLVLKSDISEEYSEPY